jgi:hypothetical protein
MGGGHRHRAGGALSMTTRVLDSGRLRYTVSLEDAAPPANAAWAVVQARGIDELTGEPPLVPVSMRTELANFSPRTAAGGLAALAGIPAQLFPKLAAQPYDVPFTLSADGYLPVTDTADLPADAQFPARFVPARMGDYALHREPVEIFGRVFQRVNGNAVAVPNAQVEITEVWPMIPPPDGSVPPEGPFFVSLHPPLLAPRNTAAGRLRRRNVTPVLGQDKALEEAAEAGSLEMTVSNRTGLNPNTVVLVDADPAIQELLTIDTITPVGAPDLPAVLRFTHATAYRHRRGALVRRVTLAGPGPARQFQRDAIPGDRTVFLNNLNTLSTARVVEVFGGAAAELHALGLPAVQADGEGAYRLPPLHRVAQLTVQATDGGNTSDPVTFVPDYTRRENRLDIGF